MKTVEDWRELQRAVNSDRFCEYDMPQGNDLYETYIPLIRAVARAGEHIISGNNCAALRELTEAVDWPEDE